MQIIKLRQDFYRTTAYVCAEIVTGEGTITVYDGEIAFKMQPDISIKPILPLQPFCRSWVKDQPLGFVHGRSDQLESLKSAIVSFIKRIHRKRLTEDAEIILDVEILAISEQEEFEMTGLHPDFQNAVIRFYFERG